MKNEELLCRHGSRLNPFTTALRDACLAQGKVLVRMRSGDWCEVVYAPPEDEHPYDDCPDGGFRSPDSSRYWLANGESITGDRFDLAEFESGPGVPAQDIALDKETLTRLRRILRLLQLGSAVPEDDEALSGSLFSVFGLIASTLEKRKPI